MNEIYTLSILTCLLIWLAFAIYIIWSWFNTPWYPTQSKHLKELLNSKIFKLPEEGKFIDLGSGDGKVANWFADKGMEAEGIEFNPFFTITHRIKNIFRKNKTKVLHKNFFNHNFRAYDVVYMYIYKEHMDRIKDKLFKEMKPGSLIISNVFTFSDLKPDEEIGRFRIYKVPENES